MKNILVLQNYRIGDTLQTTPLLVGLREKYDPCHIKILANKMFADLDLGDLVDEVIYFDQNGLYRMLQDPRSSIIHKYDQARAFLDLLRKRHFDLVIDVPADTYMHLIASALDAPGEVKGVTLSPMRAWTYSHPEVMLFYTIGLCREVNRFNLVDLHNLLAGVRPSEKRLHLPVSRDAEEFAAGFLVQNGVAPGKDFIVALQPGASEERKRWGDSHFADLARMLVQRMGAKILICGSASEQASADKICEEARVPLISAVGKTRINQLAALVGKCNMLVTNDTGTLHIAAAVGTPVLDISTGPVNFRETGPYKAGGLVIEGNLKCSPCNFNAQCHHYACREAIKPDMVFRIVEMIRSGKDASSLSEADFKGTLLHVAEFNDVGRLDFSPVFRYPTSLHGFLSFFYAHTWEVFYGLRMQPKSASELVSQIENLHDLSRTWDGIADQVRQCMDDFRYLETELDSACNVFASLRHSCRKPDLQCAQLQAVEEFQVIYQSLLSFGRTRPAIRHFTSFLELAVESQGGSEPAVAIKKIEDLVQFAAGQVRFLRAQLIEATQLLDKMHAATACSLPA
jgi:ADP-heptose:LPS heptosyltransferase